MTIRPPTSCSHTLRLVAHLWQTVRWTHSRNVTYNGVRRSVAVVNNHRPLCLQHLWYDAEVEREASFFSRWQMAIFLFKLLGWMKQVYRRRYEKAAARQSLNCIKNKNKIKYVEKRFSIWRMEFLHPAMWHVALESWQWIHQVAAPYNVIRGSRMTCHWIRPNVRHIGILHLVSISTHHRSRHVILYQSSKLYPNRTTLGRKKWRHVDFQDGGSQPSWIVGIQ